MDICIPSQVVMLGKSIYILISSISQPWGMSPVRAGHRVAVLLVPGPGSADSGPWAFAQDFATEPKEFGRAAAVLGMHACSLD